MRVRKPERDRGDERTSQQVHSLFPARSSELVLAPYLARALYVVLAVFGARSSEVVLALYLARALYVVLAVCGARTVDVVLILIPAHTVCVAEHDRERRCHKSRGECVDGQPSAGIVSQRVDDLC